MNKKNYQQYYHYPPRGVSFIEVLITVVLTTTILLSTSSWMSYSIARLKQSYYQSAALEQLQGIALLLRAFPDQNEKIIAHWKEQAGKVLPSYFSWKLELQPPVRVWVEWPSPMGSMWRCQKMKESNKSCLEVSHAS